MSKMLFRINPGIVWIKAAVDAFLQVKAISAGQTYYFPKDCSEKDFLEENSIDSLFHFSYPLNGLKSFEIRREVLTRIKEEFEEEFEKGVKRISMSVLPFGEIPEGTVSVEYELRERGISLSHAHLTCLVRQLIERGVINATYVSDPVLQGYRAFPEEIKKISKMNFYTVEDLCVKLDMDHGSLTKMITSGKLVPNFTLKVEGRETEYVFLEIPKIPKFKGGDKR